MTLYEGLVFVHILGVIVWLGAGITLHIASTRAIRDRDPQRIAAFGQENEWGALRVFMPASIVVLVSGLWAVTEGGWGFEDTWVGIGLAILVAVVIIGNAFIRPTGKKLGAVMAAGGGGSPEAQRLVKRAMWGQRVSLVLLVLAVADMVVKPGLR